MFSYLDGKQVKTMGSREARLKMDEAIRDDRAWLKAFKIDEKEMLRVSKQDYFEVDAEGGDLWFVSIAKNVS